MTTPRRKRAGFTFPRVVAILILISVVIASVLFVLKSKDDSANEELVNEAVEELNKEREKLQAAIDEVTNLQTEMIEGAENRAIDAAVAELNSREALAWGEALLNGTDIEANGVTVDYDLGEDYSFDGTNLTFGNTTVKLSSVGPTNTSPRAWSR